MNGIIRPFTHPENRPAPKTEEEMFVSCLFCMRLSTILLDRPIIIYATDYVCKLFN